MNILFVALKDLKRTFRSLFAIIMMFGAPLLIAGLLYFAFGSMASGGDSFTLAPTRLVIANLDQAGSSGTTFKAGEMLVSFLNDKELGDIDEISMASDENSAPSSRASTSRASAASGSRTTW